MVELVYWDFDKHPVSVEQYKSFLESYYGEDAKERFVRMMWYRQRNGYAILLALENGKLLGQSSAYQVSVIVDGFRQEFWWSVDTFVLPIARGKGIGKKLQKKLHEDFPNFSSLWYSKTNGLIKRKCGACEFLKVRFNYYPVNSFFTVLFCVFAKRVLHKELSFPIGIWRDKYYTLNKICRGKNKFDVKEVDLCDKMKELSVLAKQVLEGKDFYVVRDADYLVWKYLNNPTIGEYKTLFFYSTKQSEKLMGAIVFSVPYLKKTFSIPLRVFTVLDCFTISESLLAKKDMLCSAIRYFHKRHVAVDGVLTLEDYGYFPFLRHPWKGTALLSTCKNVSEIKAPYLSYSDQDMEQMIL